MKAIASAGLCGLLFGVGLTLSQMTNPARVIGFLDFAGQWDPSLLWVMAGAIGVHLPLRLLIERRGRPQFAASFSVAPPSRVDARLLCGAAIFGIGWGASGYCPAPAIASATTSWLALSVLLAMLVGFLLHDLWFRSASRAFRSGNLPKLSLPNENAFQRGVSAE